MPSHATLQIPIAGMTCAACSTRLERNLNRLEGVCAQVNLATEQAQVAYDPALTSPAQVLDQVARTGFSVPPQTLDLAIAGMTCAACSSRLERVLGQLPGVLEARVNLATEKARVRYAPELSNEAAVLAAVARAGFTATPVTEAARTETKARKDADYRRERLEFLIAALLTLPLVAQMGAMFAGRHDLMLPDWLQLLLATPVQFWAGWRFYRGGWNALRGGGANMDVLVALGTSAAYFFSLYLMTTGGHVYFEASAAVITLVRLGKLLEARAKTRTSAAIEQLIGLQPRTAQVERDGEAMEVETAQLRLGDVVVVRAGERVAVDGSVLEGVSGVDESLLTGESLPLTKRPGDRVHAGTQNLEGLLRVRAEGVGAHTQLMEIVRLTEAAQGSKAPIQRLADRISEIFVPVVLGLAALTFLGWWLGTGDFTQSLIPAVAVLVIACPCALGLATPTAVMVGLGRGAQLGILVREAQALERAEKLTVLALDKTGTLTEGRMALVGEPENEMLRLAAALEQGSTHPIAQALLAAAAERGLALPAVTDFENRPGEGVAGVVEGRRLVLASPPPWGEGGRSEAEVGRGWRPQDALGATQTDALRASHSPQPSPPGGVGATSVVLTEADVVLARFDLADRLRTESAAAVARLNALGIRILMLTGDNPEAAAAIAAQAGIADFRAQVRPQDKAAAVNALKSEGAVTGMAGDGINDAPALAAADVSFSLAGGSDIALETADISLMRADLHGLADAVELSRAVMKKIRQNLFFAFFYNVLGLPLAAAGLLNPVLAGAAMALSSVSVVTNALTLRRWRPSRR